MTPESKAPIRLGKAKGVSKITKRELRKSTEELKLALASGCKFARLSKKVKLLSLTTIMWKKQKENPELSLYDFTLQLSKPLAAKLDVGTVSGENRVLTGKLTQAVQRKIQDDLKVKGVSSTAPEMWLVVETEGKNGEPTATHLHGMILISSDALKKVKAAFRSVAKVGADGEISPNAVVMRPFPRLTDSHGWTNYCLKNSSSKPYIERRLRAEGADRWNNRKDAG
jgi:hypothetical protein